jgi:hypothetical protein
MEILPQDRGMLLIGEKQFINILDPKILKERSD